MTTRKGINISGHYIVSTNATSFHICTLNYEKQKGQTESYFIMFLKLNDHPIRCFNFGLRRIYPNGCNFERGLTIGEGGNTTISSPGGHQNNPFRG